MRKLRIIVTACGCPGASTFIRMLKENGERDIEIIGVDMSPQAIGRFLCDKFVTVPSGDHPEYIPHLLDLVRRESPDVVFPQSSAEVYPIAQNKQDFEATGTKVIVSNPEAIKVANNKLEMYEHLESETSVPKPKYFGVNSLHRFKKAVHALGYPEKPVCFKPTIGKGSRGFRIMDSRVNRADLLLNQKPNSRYITLDEFIEIFEHQNTFPNLLVMEFIQGQEYTTDAICVEGNTLLTMVKSVEEARWGVIVKGESLDKPNLVAHTKTILARIPLSYCVNIQFIEDVLIEINPRVSSFIYQENLIPPYIAIKMALGEITSDQVNELQDKVRFGRRMLRYMDQVFWEPT